MAVTPTIAAADELTPSTTPLISVEGEVYFTLGHLSDPPVISGDGNWIAFAEGEEGLYTIKRINRTTGQITTVAGPGPVNRPSISYDGSKIAYSGVDLQTSQFEVRLWSASTGRSQRLNDGTNGAGGISLSDDGRRAVWTESGPTTADPLALVVVWTEGQAAQSQVGTYPSQISGNGEFAFYSDVDEVTTKRWNLQTGEVEETQFAGDVSDDGSTVASHTLIDGLPATVLYDIDAGVGYSIPTTDDLGLYPTAPALAGNQSLMVFRTQEQLAPEDAVQATWDHYQLGTSGNDLVRLVLTPQDYVVDLSDNGKLALVMRLKTWNTYDLLIATMVTDLVRPPADGERPADDQIRRLYRAVFDREPDGEGGEFWKDVYRSARPLLEIAANFQGTPEFKSAYGQNPSDETLIAKLYENVLDRTPDSEGSTYWLNKRKEGMTIPELMIAFSDSPENIVKTISSQPLSQPASAVLRVYRATFGRSPDLSGFNYWVDKHKAGLSLEAVAASFIESPEAQAKYGDDINDGVLVHTLYQNVLGRPADPDGFDHWIMKRAEGMTVKALIVVFANSKENLELTGTAP